MPAYRYTFKYAASQTLWDLTLHLLNKGQSPPLLYIQVPAQTAAEPDAAGCSGRCPTSLPCPPCCFYRPLAEHAVYTIPSGTVQSIHLAAFLFRFKPSCAYCLFENYHFSKLVLVHLLAVTVFNPVDSEIILLVALFVKLCNSMKTADLNQYCARPQRFQLPGP